MLFFFVNDRHGNNNIAWMNTNVNFHPMMMMMQQRLNQRQTATKGQHALINVILKKTKKPETRNQKPKTKKPKLDDGKKELYNE